MLIDHKIEDNLLYKLLIQPEHMDEVTHLSARDFNSPRNQQLFAEMMIRFENSDPIDVMLIESALGITIDLTMMAPGSVATVSDLAAKVKDLSVRRSLIHALDVAKARIEDGEDAVPVATAAIDAITRTGSTSTLSTEDAIREYRDGYVRRATGSSTVPYGIRELDSLLLPMRAGKLVIFAARPGIGKTAIAESIGDFAGERVPVLFVSLEMGSDDLIDRGLARVSGRAAGDIIKGEVDVTELEPHLRARADLNITYLDKGIVGATEIQRAINQVRLHNDGEIGLVIVDYLQLMDGEPRHDEFQRVSNISHALKRISMVNDVPVLALAQLNRAIETDGGRSPRLADLAKSDSIGQDADVVVVINGRVGDPMRQFHVIKQRQGPSGRVDVMFDGTTQRWGDEADGVY